MARRAVRERGGPILPYGRMPYHKASVQYARLNSMEGLTNASARIVLQA
jgi:hypothetical protein